MTWRNNQSRGKYGQQQFRADVGGRRIWWRSKLEWRWANVLQLQLDEQMILSWDYEPKEFLFYGPDIPVELKPILRGTNTYRPDFRVVDKDETIVWYECKGYMDAKSKTKLRRFRQYYPGERLSLVVQRAGAAHLELAQELGIGITQMSKTPF